VSSLNLDLYRHYPLGKLGTHAIGYISRINEKDLQKLKEDNVISNYKGTDHIGKGGVEQSYERELAWHHRLSTSRN
jgi:penicillin-binding protein 2